MSVHADSCQSMSVHADSCQSVLVRVKLYVDSCWFIASWYQCMSVDISSCQFMSIHISLCQAICRLMLIHVSLCQAVCRFMLIHLGSCQLVSVHLGSCQAICRLVLIHASSYPNVNGLSVCEFISNSCLYQSMAYVDALSACVNPHPSRSLNPLSISMSIHLVSCQAICWFILINVNPLSIDISIHVNPLAVCINSCQFMSVHVSSPWFVSIHWQFVSIHVSPCPNVNVLSVCMNSSAIHVFINPWHMRIYCQFPCQSIGRFQFMSTYDGSSQFIINGCCECKKQKSEKLCQNQSIASWCLCKAIMADINSS
jgi:hypothetical protein